MSNTTASLRHKIDSAEDLQGVVRTMKAVAASSIDQYTQSVFALNDYYRSVELGLGLCLRQMRVPPGRSSGALEQGKKLALTRDTVGAIVFGSDQGLVGQFNESLTAYVQKTLSDRSPLPPKIWAVGERMRSRLAEAGLKPAQGFHVPQSVNGITPLVSQLLMESETAHAQGGVSALYLFYNRPMTGAVYTPFCHALLPLDLSHQQTPFAWPGVCLPRLVGDPATTLPLLIGEHLFVSLFRACAESLASENASRLAAMQRADKNIDELLTTLNRDFYRLRQRGIDEELFDVLAGFEALKR